MHAYVHKKKKSLLSIDVSAPCGDSVVGRTQSLGFSLGMMMTSVFSTPVAFSLSMKKGTYIDKYYNPVRFASVLLGLEENMDFVLYFFTERIPILANISI